ncbi:TetR/AcrR family transcriptional regulator [Paenirhodobacter populi]|uniref:TetR/AcrR family transcriptional regulator n=1 Tax=Paenirhodobacter populi TaxID=2306993 RepID=A0A443JRJ7_9RHOB|nr:TetR/AcrR family transcriptional regulator [Sinirhodobacter populi]RWR23128.1 TetR/AcrR family transcriptional regulator [Sinirhodobacter populi]
MPRPDKRQHLVDTAYACFKREGFHAIGIDRIISEADVARMTLYRNFPSKDDLILEVLDQRAERFDAQLDRLAEAPGPARIKLAAIFDWYEIWVKRKNFHGCIFAHAIAEYGDAENPVHQRAVAQKMHHQQMMAAILRTEVAENRADFLASALLMLIEGAVLMAHAGQGAAAMITARAAAMALLAAEGITP